MKKPEFFKMTLDCGVYHVKREVYVATTWDALLRKQRERNTIGTQYNGIL